MICPDSAEDRADKTEQCRETDYAISHPRQRIGRLFVQRARKHTADHVKDREHSGEKHCRVAGGNTNHVGREPDIGVEHGLQHFQRVAAAGEMVRDD